MKRLRYLLAASALLLLAGCATRELPEPRELYYTAPVDKTLRQAVDLMIAQGYVVKYADLALGRADATLARWPEYRIQLHVHDEKRGSRVRVIALRGHQPLPPYLLDPWLIELQHLLGEAP